MYKEVGINITDLWHLCFGVSSQKGEIVDFILNHKVLLFSFKILEKNNKISVDSIMIVGFMI